MILTAAATALLLGPRNRQPEIVLTLIGGYVLGNLLWDAWKSRNRESLFLCLWLLVPLPIVYYSHLPIKYLLPSMPAIILLCFRLSSAMPARIARTAGILVVIGGLAYSCQILRADVEFADFGGDVLPALIRPRLGLAIRYGFQISFQHTGMRRSLAPNSRYRVSRNRTGATCSS
jgi:hypothetical protein